MASFDIVSKVDIQKLDNAINTTKKEIIYRYDFHDSKTTIELDKKTMSIEVLTESEMRMQTIQDVIISRAMKQGLHPDCLDFGKEQYASGNMIRKDVKVKQGIDKDTARKIVKTIKDARMKVQAQIMDEQIRVTGKKFDDLQTIMNIVRQNNFELPLQFDNYK